MRTEAQFWARVDQHGPVPTSQPHLENCWIWTGARSSNGYGRIQSNRRNLWAHRVAFQYANGVIEPGALVLHRCDTPLCVRPAHLFLGTHADNTRDAARKGRLVIPTAPRLQGEQHPGSKLTQVAVDGIRTAYATGNVTQNELAQVHGVSRSLIGLICSGAIWASDPSAPTPVVPEPTAERKALHGYRIGAARLKIPVEAYQSHILNGEKWSASKKRWEQSRHLAMMLGLPALRGEASDADAE